MTLALTLAMASWWYNEGGPGATLRGHDSPIYTVAFSPDGKLLASGGVDRVVRIWDLITLRQRFGLTGHTGFIDSVTFSPDGMTLATTATHDDRDMRLWDVPSGRLLATISGSERPSWTGRNWLVSPDGKLRLEADRTYSFRTLALIDAKTDRKLVTLKGHPDQLNDWAFAPGGEILATGGGCTDHPWPINAAGDMRLWEARTGRLLAKINRFWGAVSSVKFSPDGTLLVAASYDGTIRLWNLAQILDR